MTLIQLVLSQQKMHQYGPELMISYTIYFFIKKSTVNTQKSFDFRSFFL